MNIIEMNVDELIPYENNPRKNDEAVDKVALSISAFGFKVPIVIDANKVIVTGHTRLKAAKKLGMKTVPCIMADDLTDEQIKAFRLADNKVAEFSEWDEEKLMQELESLGDMDMSLYGFQFPDDTEDGEDDTYSELPIRLPMLCGRYGRLSSFLKKTSVSFSITSGNISIPVLKTARLIGRRLLLMKRGMSSTAAISPMRSSVILWTMIFWRNMRQLILI